MAGLLSSLGLSAAVQALAGIPSIALSTERYYDLAGSATFGLLTAVSLWLAPAPRATRVIVQGLCVLAWATRLGTFLASRVHLNGGVDRRFAAAKKSVPLFAFYWALQGLWVWLSLLPTLMLSSSTAPAARAEVVHTTDLVGFGLFLVGFVLETLADRQKSAFRANPANKERFIASGLWAISRHPNYFGEILVWVGLFVSALPALWDSPARLAGGALSPIFVAFLLTRLSGIPILEKSANKRWGAEASFQAYKRKTALLVPWLW